MTESPNVYQRMSKVCKIIGSQAWVKSMENNQFKSIPIDAMRKGVREACVEAGLIHIGPVGIDYTKDTSPDGRTIRYMGTCTFKYINIDKPDERIMFESMGEAMDNGDKCVGKFITNLIKNHYKSAFDIGEQGKDDVDSYSNEEYFEQDARIKERIAKAEATRKEDPFFGTPAKTEQRTFSGSFSERDSLIKELKDKVLEGGNDADVINKMVADFKKSSLNYCRTDELRKIKETVCPFPTTGGA